jgi:acetyl-CoA carboxylase biotin carboxyl carrier protein
VKESELADDASPSPAPFDVSVIGRLVSLMSKHDLSEIDLRQGDRRIRLRRGQRLRQPAAAPLPDHQLPVAAKPVEVTTKPVEKPAASSRKLVDIKSPTVGTFYAQPNPDAPAYVTVGARVTPTTIVCMIEAMKIFNEIPAECTGVIVEVVAKNKEPVEFGSVLFRVDPNG